MFSWFKKRAPEAVKPKLVPRIKHIEFVAASKRVVEQAGYVGKDAEDLRAQLPIHEPLVGDLVLAYALDVGHSFLFLDETKLAEHGLDRQGLRASARAAVEAEMQQGAEILAHGNIRVLQAPNNLAACSILFPELWKALGKSVGGPIVASFPHRDYVMFGNGADPDQVAALRRELASEADPTDNHSLSRLLYAFDGADWRVVDA